MKHRFFIFTIAFLVSACLYAQADVFENKYFKFDGVLKVKGEVSLDGGGGRFDVRNSRLGLRGDFGQYFSYRAQIDLSNEGSFSVLDLYGEIKPLKGLKLMIGQSSIPFLQNYLTSPAEMIFANRTFIAKYFLPSTRDIGFVASYKTPTELPLTISAGVFNGGKINNPIWTKAPSFAANLTLGDYKKLSASAKVYRLVQKEDVRINDSTSLSMDMKYLMYGLDFSYLIREKILLQCEFTQKYAQAKKDFLSGFYIMGGYYFFMKDAGLLKYIMPTIRYDAMTYALSKNPLQAQRASVGINFGLTKKIFSSVIRIDYENYFLSGRPMSELAKKGELASHDKLTIELVFKF